MSSKTIKKLQCTYCNKPFKKLTEVGDSLIAGCACDSYPLVSGIFYLKKDDVKKKALNFLEQGDERRALFKLLNLRRRLFLPIFLLFFSQGINFLSLKVFKKPIYKLLGFEKVVRLLSLFSYDKSWVWYLINRKRIPSYFFSLLSTNFVRKDHKVIDTGCGVGHLLPELEKKVSLGNVFGVDSSFLNLFFARKYFANTKTLLICCDVEKGLPFINSSVNLVTTTDTFHYLKRKRFFLKEVERIVEPKGAVAFLHTLTVPRLRNIRGISAKRLKKIAQNVGFKKVSIYSNETLWELVNNNDNVYLNKSDSDSKLDECGAYNFFATKNSFSKYSIRLDILHYRLLKEINIFYGWEPELRVTLRLKSILRRYDEFIFISSHLDDAILSCGMLLNKLKALKKNIKVITVFTKGGDKPFTPQAEKFLQDCGYSDVVKLFEERKKEDREALNFLGADFKHLGFIDAAWRKDEKERNIYKNEKIQFSGKIAKHDRELVDKITQKISSLIPKGKHIIVFAPLGVGNHMDHIIIREAIRRLSTPTIFWEDFPYNLNKANLKKLFLENKNFRLHFSLDNGGFTGKEKAIRMYKSQISSLFSDGVIHKVSENYYTQDTSICIKNNYFGGLYSNYESFKLE